MRPASSSPPRVVLYNPRAVFYTMPLALVAIASALDRARVKVDIIDGRLEADPVRRVVEAAEGALCVGVTVLTGAPIRDALVVSRAVKALHPSVPVVWGGWHPSLFPHQCLDDRGVDLVVVGQGEDAFRGVVERLMEGERVTGCVATPALRDLNELPPHDYSLIPVETYFALKRRRQIDYISSQGCRFRCAFCADPAVYGRGWTGLAPERVADEIATLQRRYRADDVAFQDETFFTYPERVARLCEALLARGVAVTWTATLRADQACRMGSELLGLCVRAGLRRVMIGVESGSPDTLARLRKDLTLEQVHAAAAMCARFGLGAIFNFIVGFPGEDDASVDATLRLARQLRAMSPRFETPIFYYRPYPGNPIASEAQAQGYRFPSGLAEWADFDYVSGPGPWVDARRWKHVERFKFYTRQAWAPGAWRWPLRAAARWRCAHGWYAWPVEKALVEWVRPPQQVS